MSHAPFPPIPICSDGGCEWVQDAVESKVKILKNMWCVASAATMEKQCDSWATVLWRHCRFYFLDFGTVMCLIYWIILLTQLNKVKIQFTYLLLSSSSRLCDFICVAVLHASMHTLSVCAWGLWKQEWGDGYLRTGITGGCELPCEF